MRELRKNKNLAAIESDYARQNPEIKLIINRKKAQALARRRFASSGEDCYEQIMLLEEKTSMGGSFYEDLAS